MVRYLHRTVSHSLAWIAARAGWRAKRRAEKLAAKTRPVEVEWPDDWPVEWIPSEADGDAMLGDIPF